MGSGKTSVGKCLAQKLNMQFVDVDFFIENRYRKSINEIFETKGENEFRKMEHLVIEEIASFENVIISTGGGAPCFYNNIDLMNRTGLTVYLKVSEEELAKRLNCCKSSRPLLKNKSSEELLSYVSENLNKREPVYSQAQLIFDAEKMLDNTDIEHIVNNLILKISSMHAI